MTESQRFGSFSIPFNMQSLLIFVMGRVTDAEKVNHMDEKRLPRTGSFNFGKSMVDLYQDYIWHEVAYSNRIGAAVPLRQE
ncbi:hypothetical protein TNCT_341031 [Trichonephila clavata]|uniref:Uncharacterized protein n=1 Tax=Trichonephila clavata TaxID=2740835 RepID=A0A8X6J842_TRICU|nr:hypothetical protein TNCT_341031 [Trichonephila clavata]